MTRHLLALTLIGCAATLGAQQAPAPDRTRPPQPGLPPTLNLPAIQKLQLANGLPVWLVELHEVPVVQVNLLVFSGTANDPAGKFGVASLTAAMLQEGAGSRSSLELADAVDFLGADLSVTSGSDSSAVRLHVPGSRLADALPIMADVAQRPTFPREELERLRTERLTNVIQARDNPATINATAFARILYGPTHRYGTPAAGTAATLRSITVDDLRGYYTNAFQPGNAALIVVGDVTAARVLPLLELSFGRWTSAASPPVPARLPNADQHALRIIYLIDKPGAPQSQIRIGWIGVPRSTPDYFPIEVMNTILGGSFSSRLNLNLREKNGYTYGAGSSFDMRLSAGPFFAAAAVQTDKTADAIREFINELNGIAARLVPADELARARNYLALRFPADFESTGDISRQLENLLVYKLPDDYFSKYVASIGAVTAADVQRVARRYVQPNRFAFVVTGDKAAIEPAIAMLKLGEIKPVTIDDVFGPAPVIR
jgi:predicted Zn-dependent peptidase